jgi:hypothetical protein
MKSFIAEIAHNQLNEIVVNKQWCERSAVTDDYSNKQKEASRFDPPLSSVPPLAGC